MGLNLFKKTIKVNYAKEEILGLLGEANKLLDKDFSLGFKFLSKANNLYNECNSFGQSFKLIPEIKETFFNYLEIYKLSR